MLIFYQTPSTTPLLNKDLQPPTQPAKTLAALSEAVAAGIGSEDGVVDRAGTQRAPEQVILFFWGQEGAIAVWHCLGLPGGCS